MGKDGGGCPGEDRGGGDWYGSGARGGDSGFRMGGGVGLGKEGGWAMEEGGLGWGEGPGGGGGDGD